jgi:RNA polymerase sigma-70 factor (ECF subfamily)
MRNLFINRYRQRQREPESIDWEKVERDYETTIAGEGKSDRLDPETLVFSKLTGDEINKALQELPEEFRTAIVLVDVEELRYEEAAQVMKCPVGTVRSRLFRGRRLLQIALRDYAVERGLMKKIDRRRVGDIDYGMTMTKEAEKRV